MHLTQPQRSRRSVNVVGLNVWISRPLLLSDRYMSVSGFIVFSLASRVCWSLVITSSGAFSILSAPGLRLSCHWSFIPPNAAVSAASSHK